MFFSCLSCLTMTSVSALDSRIESALQWAVNIANDNSHGYSWDGRWGPDYDCSSLVITAFKNAGFNVGSATYTGNMRTVFEEAGFTWIPKSQINLSNSSQLQRGDILLNESSHTEIYLGNGQNVGAHRGYKSQWCSHSNNDGKYHRHGHYSLGEQQGDQDGGEISVAGYYNYPWDGVLRYQSKEPEDNYVDLGTNFYAVIKNTKYNNYVSKTDNSDDIYLQEENNTSKQVWYFERQEDGAYSISSCYDGKYLEMTNGIRENGTQITAHDNFWGGYYQQWYLIESGDGYKLQSKHYTSEGWYLDRSGNGSNKVQIYEEFEDASDQIWTISKEEAIADMGDKFYSVIINTKHGDCISRVNGTNNVYVKETDNTSYQVWYFERKDDGAYAISSSYDGKYLEMTSGIRENRTQISVADTYWDGYCQQWYLIPSGDGYRFLNKHFTSEGWYLDRSARGDEVAQIYEKYSVQDDQIWTIDKESAVADLGEKFDAVISNTKYNKAFTRVDDSNQLFLYDKDNTKAQGWSFVQQSNGTYVIYSKVDGKVLEMTSGIRENRTQISVVDTYWGGYYQQWYLIPSGDGYRFLSNHYTSEGWYLDRSGSGNNHLQIFEKYEDQDDQIWSLSKYIEPPIEHNWKEASCTEKKTCLICGITEGQPLGHSYTSKVIESATCTEDGIRTYTCSTCGDTYAETISATGHTEVLDKGYEATYEKEGLTDGSHCSVCKKVIVEQKIIPMIVLIGDADGDGEVNVMDVTTIQMHVAKYKVENINLSCADVDGDGEISVIDATLVQMYIAELIKSF